MKVIFEDDQCVSVKVKGTIFYPFNVTLFKEQFRARVTGAPPTSGGPHILPFTSGTNSTTSTIIMAVIIAVLFLAIIVLVYQRRKLTNRRLTDEEFQAKNESKYPNSSVMNNAYAPDEYTNGVFIEPVDPSNFENTNNITPPVHSAENPIYTCYVDNDSDQAKASSESSENE